MSGALNASFISAIHAACRFSSGDIRFRTSRSRRMFVLVPWITANNYSISLRGNRNV